jgi:hypothetical protein
MQIAAGCEKQVRQSEIEVDPSVGPVGKLLGTIKKTLKSGRRKPNGAAPAEAHGARRSDR